MGIIISNSQVYFLGFLFEKHSLHFVGNKGIYSMGKDLIKQNITFCKQRLLRVLHELALLTKQSRKLQPDMTLHLPVMCSTHGFFASCFFRANHEIHLFIFWSLILHRSLTLVPLQLNLHTYKENDWRNYNQIWHRIKAFTV